MTLAAFRHSNPARSKTRRRAVVLGAAVVLVLTVAACAGDDPPDEPSPPGVSSLDYSPNPFSKDRTTMKVRFTTTGPAGEGRTYVAHVSARGDHSGQRCYPEHASDDLVEGESGETYEVSINSQAFFDDATFCAGEAELVIWTENVDGPPMHGPPLRMLSLRVLPPRSG